MCTCIQNGLKTENLSQNYFSKSLQNPRGLISLLRTRVGRNKNQRHMSISCVPSGV